MISRDPAGEALFAINLAAELARLIISKEVATAEEVERVVDATADKMGRNHLVRAKESARPIADQIRAALKK